MDSSKKNSLYYAEDISIGAFDIAPVKGEKGIYNLKLCLKVDARIVMDKLDLSFGPLNWQRKLEITVLPNGRKQGHCTLSVWDENMNRWISRDDYSQPYEWAGDTEDKVIAGDSLKRAATLFGIGRELYSFDNINTCSVIDNEKVINIVEDEFGQIFCPDHFKVTQLIYDDRDKIEALAIKDLETNKMVFVKSLEDERKAGVTWHHEDLKKQRLKKALLVVCDVGPYAGKPLSECSMEEASYVFSHTKSKEVKEAAYAVVEAFKKS